MDIEDRDSVVSVVSAGQRGSHDLYRSDSDSHRIDASRGQREQSRARNISDNGSSDMRDYQVCSVP